MSIPKRRPPNAGKGRPKGVPNKATTGVREAFQKLVEGNLDELCAWLTKVAEGIKEAEPVLDANGDPELDDSGEPKVDWNWLIRPDPATAFKLVMDLAEYHIPKLSRIEHGGTVGIKTVDELTDAEINARLARLRGSGAANGAVEAPDSPPDPAGVH